ncbi:hypothetical protein D0T12_29260 [Actinomadura spongiicola]|uniref:Uncharacterized protein n=1 Tax=Actinomadura spongiicola TaxID=2303421 RepID=A0A372G9Q7_9ACTN|nr:hypothetical protein D0T12_29260 [Actinomadura spongiicola]
MTVVRCGSSATSFSGSSGSSGSPGSSGSSAGSSSSGSSSVRCGSPPSSSSSRVAVACVSFAPPLAVSSRGRSSSGMDISACVSCASRVMTPLARTVLRCRNAPFSRSRLSTSARTRATRRLDRTCTVNPPTASPRMKVATGMPTDIGASVATRAIVTSTTTTPSASLCSSIQSRTALTRLGIRTRLPPLGSER